MARLCRVFTVLAILAIFRSAGAGDATGEIKPEIAFLDQAAAGAAILDDKAEPYFETLQATEMSAKTKSAITGDTLADQRAECRRRYQAAALDFSDDEKTLLKACLEKVYPAIAKDYPLYAKVPWSFIKVAGNIEGGMPHTRGPNVVLSDKALKRFLAMQKKFGDDQALPQIAMVLLHEQFHVFQRRNPELIGKLYTDVWGFKHVDKIEGCDWLTARHLANPDGLDCRWIFPVKKDDAAHYILPLVVFDSPDKPQVMGRDFRMIALELEGDDKQGYRVKMGEDKVPVHSGLMEVTDYTDKFSAFNEIFHPNESSAVAFSLAVMLDTLKPKGETVPKKFEQIEKQLAPVKAWMKENLTGK